MATNPYNTGAEVACVQAGGTWSGTGAYVAWGDSEDCIFASETAGASIQCYENSGVRTGSSKRGWSPPTMLAVGDLTGDGNVDIIYGSDSSSAALEDGSVD